MDLKINEEFKSLIPSLTDEEYEGLEQSIIQDGCRDRIVTWNSYIIDGHNRYEICNKHNITFEVLEKDNFASEADVKLWMIENQLGKRNLPTEARLALVYCFKEIEAGKAKARQLANLKQFSDSSEANTESQFTDSAPVRYREEPKGKTLESIAKKAGVSIRTAEQYDAIQRKGTDDQKAQVDSGQSSIKKVYNQIQQAERLKQNKQLEWPEGKYRIIYADPPWKYGDERSGMGGAVDQYDLMDLEDIKALPVADLAEENSVLFMWGTAPLLQEALEVIVSWGFQYKTHMVWNKQKGPQGNYISPRHEILFIATKGSCTPDTNERPNSVQTIERTGRHSEKPEEFRLIIEQLYNYGNKIEIFARKTLEGWESYGNEI